MLFQGLQGGNRVDNVDIKIPEKNKRAGVSYAVTDDGIELPVIDVTHPAFALKQSAAELSELLLRAATRRKRVPDFIQRLYYRFVFQRSILVRRVEGASGVFMSGMSTYLGKLGPDNLGKGYAKPRDRKFAAFLPFLSIRLRLHHMARLLADGIAPALREKPGRPFHLLNIAGGPAMDSLNALILLQKENPQWLAGRKICIHVLDRERTGPDFGARALTALCGLGAPLRGLDVSFQYLHYDWSDVAVLRQLLGRLGTDGSVVAGSSEGGLFVYGSDEEILANLEALQSGTPDDSILVGSMSRADGPAGVLNRRSQIGIRPREAEAFETLVQGAGWTVSRLLEGALGYNFSLAKTSGKTLAS
jgi:hypothetical protein